jgi:hypothetical protein
VKYQDHHTAPLGVDGIPKVADGIGVVTGSNGDALFFTWSGLVRPAATAGILMGENAFLVIGGRGRFRGASGSGTFNYVFDTVDKKAVTASMDGMIAIPKP